MIIILKKYGRSARFLMSCREKEIAVRVMTFIFAASTAASLKKHFPVLWWPWLWHGGLFREEIFPNGGFSDVQVMIFIITPRNNQSYLSLQQIFFYYHLVSHKEKTSIKTTPTNNVIQNGALMWESWVWVVFEEWNQFQVLFYFFNLFFKWSPGTFSTRTESVFQDLGFLHPGHWCRFIHTGSQRASSSCSEVVCAGLGRGSSQEGTSLAFTQV